MKAADADVGTRVALLARAGIACERLQAALEEAGADVVLVADPSQSDVAGVRAAGAEAILIALEPLVDEALDRYDALLADPAITVIFDEAELAAKREGWDAARWTRHLAAKLNRHQQVLPPGAESGFDGIAGADPVAARMPPVVEEAMHASPAGDNTGMDLGDLAASTDGHGLALADDMLAASDGGLGGWLDEMPTSADAGLGSADVALATDTDLSAFLDQITTDMDAHATDRDSSATSIDSDIANFLREAAGEHPDAPGQAPATSAADETFLSFDPTLAEFDLGPGTGSNAPVALDLDPIAFEGQEPAVIVADDHDAPAPDDNTATRERFRLDLDALELRIADMQLEDVRPPRVASTDGAVLVMAGIGGPDAVRQLLAGLPATFPRPVLIQQRLEGARHDNLVRQMQRATAMPVRLAESGAALERGHVYVLPTGIGIAAHADGLHFDGASDELIQRLPPGDSAIVLLSGADVAQVDAALALGIRGSLVAGQSPDGCFDAAASDALVARGGTSAAPAAIAKQLAMRWTH